jgi:PEP-CTERM motif
MNKFRQGLIATLSSIGICFSHAAFAVDSPIPTTATAIFDWSHLELSVSGVGGTVPTVVFSNYRTSLDSSSVDPKGSESNAATRNDWTSTLQTETSAGASNGSGSASLGVFSGTVNAVGADSAANSSGNRTVDFTFDGPGVLTVSVPYTMTLTGTDGFCCPFDSASVSGNASFSNFTNGGNSSSNSSVAFSLGTFGDTSATLREGNLVFGIVASDAGTGSLGIGFGLSTSGVAVVPEPESYAMLLAGLGLLGAIIRRRGRRETSLG